MALIHIKVSPLTARVLNKLYGPQEPYRIRRSDYFYHLLMMDPLRQDKMAFRRYHQELTDAVQVLVSDNMSKRLKAKQRRFTIGYQLHKAMQHMMLNFMEAQTMVGVPAQTALKAFFEHYGVGEDDYALDTAYTAWKRHASKFNLRNKGNQPGFGRKFDPRKWRKTGTPPEPIPDDKQWLISATNEHFECGLLNLLCHDIRCGSFQYVYDSELAKDWVYQRQLLAYLLREDCKLSYADISRVIRRDESTIRKGVSTIEMMLKVEWKEVVNDTAEIRRLVAKRRPNLRR